MTIASDLTQEDALRLFDGFDDKILTEPMSGCWLWLGSINKAGYGVVDSGGKKYRSHRVSFARNNGDIVGGLHVLHKCDMPSCVNPRHLFLGTHKDNMTDMAKKNRHKTGSNLKLSENDVLDIFEYFDGSRGQIKIIAAKYNVSHVTIFKILRGDRRTKTTKGGHKLYKPRGGN